MNNLNHLRHKHPRLFFLVILITFNLLLIIVATLIVFFGIGGFASLWDAFSQLAITWFLDPGFYNAGRPDVIGNDVFHLVPSFLV